MKKQMQIQLTPPAYEDLVRIRQHGHLFIHKYKAHVFYDNLWHLDPRVLDARGLVLDKKGNIVQYPFTKVFNYKENGTTIPLHHRVLALKKYNGFMACATLYKGEVLVSTTGSLDSDFVEMAKSLLPLEKMKIHMRENVSYCFEIAHPDDPHIIPEDYGVYVIGGREKKWGSKQLPVDELAHFAELIGAFAPESFETTFGELLETIKDNKTEGFVVYDLESDTVLKIKTPYYLISKFIARTKQMDKIFSNLYKMHFDEEYYPLCEHLQANYTMESFMGIEEQQRLTLIRDFFDN